MCDDAVDEYPKHILAKIPNGGYVEFNRLFKFQELRRYSDMRKALIVLGLTAVAAASALAADAAAGKALYDAKCKMCRRRWNPEPRHRQIHGPDEELPERRRGAIDRRRRYGESHHCRQRQNESHRRRFRRTGS